MSLDLSNIKPRYFKSAKDFRSWMEKNHEKQAELWVGYYKKGTAKPSIDWPQSVDVALCFGWIDGVRKSLDEESYTIRFTPRKPNSIWSGVNIRKMEEMISLGLVHPNGIAAYEKKQDHRSGIYSFEQQEINLGEEFEKKFKQNKKAWKFFQAMPASYRKPAIWWVVSAKQEATRLKRLDTLITDSEAGIKIKLLRRSGE